MLPIVVCIGSSCYVRGSERLAQAFTQLVRERGLDAKVTLTGAFCMDQCSMGVSVQVGERMHRCVAAEDALRFFEEEVVPCLKVGEA